MPEIIPNWHPIFVHFTVALVTVSVLLYLVGYCTHRFQLGREILIVARWCLWLGAIAAIATVSAGFIAYYTVAHDTPSHIVMTVHRNWAITTLVAVLLMSIWSWHFYRKERKVNGLFLMGLIAMITLLAITAWHGSELVYRHGIGVKSLPEPSNGNHNIPDPSHHNHVH